MSTDPEPIERLSPLQALDARALLPAAQVLKIVYRRRIPAHYQGNPYIREQVQVNVLLVHGGRLVVPQTPRSSFVDFYRQLGHASPALLRRILSPSGTAKSAANDHLTPIKEITGMELAGLRLPGDDQRYGWDALQAEAGEQDGLLALLFQGNGLYYNRGSVLFDGARLLAYPDLFLADLLESDLSEQEQEQAAVLDASLKRPLLFFAVTAGGHMEAFLHRFASDETYRQGMARLQESFRQRQVRCALAASPPLVIPSENHEPVYLALREILSGYQANDVRHSLYCPYDGVVLLSAELGRAQCLQPDRLAASAGGPEGELVQVRLAETLRFHRPGELASILERKGYAGRFRLDESGGEAWLSIRPLEGVYSHLLPFLTRSGAFGIIQTSGTRGNITGNDGPTIRQLSAILRDLNCQPPFDGDPILAAASGSQGNDVPNILCRARDGRVGLLAELIPESAMDKAPAARGVVTTPRVGIEVPF